MPSPFSSDAERGAFLAEPRLAILISSRLDHSPIGVPVWFDWNGKHIKMFADKSSPKVRRLKANPRVSVLVTNRLDEKEAWVAFDGDITISEEGAFALAEKLAPRYWDLDDKEKRATFDLWKSAPDAFCLLSMKPEKIRSGA